MTGNARLRDELDRRELKPSDLAKALGMRQSIVLNVLRGHQDVRLRDVASIAKALGFKADLVLEATSIAGSVVEPQLLRRSKRARVQWV